MTTKKRCLIPGHGAIAMCCAGGLMMSTAAVADLQPLAEESLGGVVARAGIALDLESRINADANGNALATLDNCVGTNKCNIALNFNNRNDNGGEWLVLKDSFARMTMRNLYLDSATLPSTATAYVNPDVFRDGNGQCLIAACNPQGLQAMQLSFPESNGNVDVELNATIGRMAVEYGAAGYGQNANGSFLGLRITDTQQRAARIDLDGKAYIYGF